jgi:type IX secretion system PorP/SprF family membrane protein
MRKRLLVAAFSASALASTAQQDPQYNLYQFNQLLINPAYAGAREGLTVAASARKQWLDFPGAPFTTALSVHGPVFNKTLGLGLTVLKDEMGPRDVIAAYGNLAYILKLNQKVRLSLGFNAGYNRFQFRFDRLEMKSAETPVELSQQLNLGALDLNSGVFLRGQDFFFGVSATHLNAANVFTFQDAASGKYNYKLNTHFFVTAGKSFPLNEEVLFSPSILLKGVTDHYSADVNLNFFLFHKLWLGAFYRTNYGPGALLQYYVTNRFRVAYSYDTGIFADSRLGGSHEIMIGYDFPATKSNKMINPRFL